MSPAPAARAIGRPALAALAALAAVAACGRGPAPLPVPEGGFAFAALGDAPYTRTDEVRFERLIDQLNRAQLAWVLSVGDILWYPCSERKFRARLAAFERIRHPLFYTPGDNDWSDCWEEIAGGHEPLDRLAKLRSVFFADPESSILGRLPVDSQAADPGHAEFVENARWRHGGVLFATLHVPGGNATYDFPGRGAADDAEVRRRTAAVVAWIRAAFAAAAAEEMKAVVLAMHADPFFEEAPDGFERRRIQPFLAVLAEEAGRWGRPVLLIHGDGHRYLVDRPLSDAAGHPIDNLIRLEVPGAPEIAWVRVVVSPRDAEPFAFETRRVRRWITDFLR